MTRLYVTIDKDLSYVLESRRIMEKSDSKKKTTKKASTTKGGITKKKTATPRTKRTSSSSLKGSSKEALTVKAKGSKKRSTVTASSSKAATPKKGLSRSKKTKGIGEKPTADEFSRLLADDIISTKKSTSDTIPPSKKSPSPQQSVFKEHDEEEEFVSRIDMNKVRTGVRRHLLMVLIWGVIFACGGAGVTYFLGRTYVAEAFLVYQQERPQQLAGTYSISQFSLPTLVQMMKLPVHFKAVKSILNLEEPVDEIIETVDIGSPHNQSNLIKIACTANNPNFVVNVVNALSTVVVKHSEELTRKQLQMAYDYFDAQQKAATQKLEIQEKSIADFKKENPHFELKSGHSTLIDTAAKVQTEYQSASLAYNRLLVEFENLQREASNIPEHTVKYAYEESPLKDRIARTEMALLEARTRYAPDNPKIKILETSLQELRKMLSDVSLDERQGKVYEKNPLKEQLNVEVMRLQGKLRSAQKLKEDLADAVEDAEKELENLPQEQIQYAKLMHRKVAAEEEIRQLNNALRSTELLLSLGKGDVEIYHKADNARAYASKWNNFVQLFPLVGFILGCFFGLGLAMVVEAVDRRLCTEKQVDLAYNIPCLQVIPEIRGLAKKDSEEKLLFFMRNLAERLETMAEGSPLSSMAFTSSLPGEGKSSLAYHFARYYHERRKKKVIFLDFDYRKNPFCQEPSEKITRKKAAPFVENYLHGEVPLSEIIRSGYVDCIKVGDDPNMKELIMSPWMNTLWNELQRKYDIIIIDTPSVVDDTYASNLIKFADCCIFVVGSSKITTSYVDSGLKELESKGVNINGIVLNRVLPVYVDDARVQAERKRSKRQRWRKMWGKEKY